MATQYAQISDLNQVISAAALTHPSTGTAAQNAALLAASVEVDEALRDQFEIPLTSPGTSVIDVVCNIAAYRLVCLRGFNPEADGHYETNVKAARSRLLQWAKGILTPDVTDSSPNAAPGVHSSEAQPNGVTASPINSTGGSTRGTSSR